MSPTISLTYRSQPGSGRAVALSADGNRLAIGAPGNDGNGSNSGHVRVYLTSAANTAPVADDDAYGTIEDTVLNVAAAGVLIGDTDPESDPLTAVLNSTTSNGSLTLNADGSFGYTPNANYCNNGSPTDDFTYHANDGSLDSNIATVAITVTCVNVIPVPSLNRYGLALLALGIGLLRFRRFA